MANLPNVTKHVSAWFNQNSYQGNVNGLRTCTCIDFDLIYLHQRIKYANSTQGVGITEKRDQQTLLHWRSCKHQKHKTLKQHKENHIDEETKSSMYIILM